MNRFSVLSACLSLVSTSLVANSQNSNMLGSLPETATVYLEGPEHCFEVDFSALWLQPSGSATSYAAEAIPLPVISPNWIIHSVKPGYHFGFDLALAYIFHDTHSKLKLDWVHFRSSDSSTTQVSPSDMIGPFFEIGPDASQYKRAKGHAKFEFDKASLEYGVGIHFGHHLKAHLFGGVAFGRIKQTMHTRFSSSDDSDIKIIDVPSTFMGAGPEFGLDFSYNVVKGLNFTGKAAGSILVGPLKNHTNYTSYSPDLIGLGDYPNRQSTQGGKKTQVVPGLDGKLGLSYLWTFNGNYSLKLEAGYEAMVYLNAIQSADIGSEVNTPPVEPDVTGVYARTFHTTLSNFALTGPYFSIDLGF